MVMITPMITTVVVVITLTKRVRALVRIPIIVSITMIMVPVNDKVYSDLHVYRRREWSFAFMHVRMYTCTHVHTDAFIRVYIVP